MREVTMYYAYDGKEFDDYDACLEYEAKAYDLVYSIGEKYEFYDENMNIIRAPFASPNVEDWLAWLNDAYINCAYIRKTGSLTDDEVEIIRENIGVFLYNEDFSCAVGLFKYDSHTMRWVKVDE